MWEYNYNYYSDDELMHYGVLGMKWGKRKAKAEYRATKKKAKAAYLKSINNGGDWDVEADKYNKTVSAAKKKYKSTVGAPKAKYKAAKNRAKNAYLKSVNNGGDIDEAANKYNASVSAAKAKYKAATRSPKQQAKAEYKAAKKKADNAYTKAAKEIDRTGRYEEIDAAADKWLADRKAAKAKYKAVKKKYR